MNIPVIDDLLGRVTNCGVDGAVREAGYLFKYRKNVTVLKENLETLKGVLSRVEDRVEECQRNARNVYEDVSKWLDDAKTMKEDLELFLRDEIQMRAQVVCFNLPFPNLYYRFKLGREAKKKSDAVSELIRNEESFEKTDREIAHLPPRVEESAAADHRYQIFESREKVLKDIVAALKEDTVARVGIYGMPGVGKTTLMEQVRSQLVGEKCFEEVALAVVSATLDVKSIQTQLAYDLGLTDLAGKEDKLERAGLLKRRLNNGKKVLLILDDVWSRLPLADMGIDFGDAKSCKILMTSRKERVCVDNNCRPLPFKIELLSKDEARCLFKQHAGDCIEKQEIRPLAEKVLKECGELPLVIRAIGEALKGGALFEWEDALERFENFNPQKIDNVDEQVYKTLELSFNLLKSKETKVCLLLCSTFEEDAEIPIEELTRLAKAMGYLPDVDSLGKARNRVLTLVKGLKSSGLLLEGRDEDTVKMHDAIRDVAVSIAHKELHYEILVKSGITEWPWEDETCQRYGAIRLRCNGTLELPSIFECPKLQTFSLINDDFRYSFWECNLNQIQVPNTFFCGLEKLNVLEMRGVCISSALLSLPNPTNLRMLRLDGLRKLELVMTTLKGLRKLEVLILGGDETIEELPLELRELKNLRVLDLRRCVGLRVSYQPGVLSSLSYLEELYLPPSYIASTSILDELHSLTRVTTLLIHLPDLMTFPDYEFCKKLVGYNVCVGEDTSYYGMGTTRGIRIDSETYVDSKGGIKVLVEGAEFLVLRGIRQLQLGSYLQEPTNQTVPSGSLSKLIELRLYRCGFKYLFSVSVARGLEQLQRLEIEECHAMEAIVRNECNGDEEENIMDHVIFHKLKYVQLKSLPHLTSFYSETRKTRENLNSNPAQSLFNEKVAFPALEKLHIWKLKSLRCIWEDEYHIGNSFSQLSWLEVQQCTRLENVIPPTMLKQLQNLEKLTIRDCAAVTSEVVTPRLAKLRGLVLQGLPNLKQTALNSNEFRGNVYTELEELHISGYGSLRNVFSPSVAKNLMHLKKLEIRDSEEIVEVIATAGQGQEETTDEIIFPQLTSLKLQNMPKLRNFWNFGCQEQHEEIKVESDLRQPQPLFGTKVAFPALDMLYIKKLESLRCIWEDEYHIGNSFSQLKNLEVQQCTRLESVVPSAMLRQLQNLETFTIRDCAAVTSEVVTPRLAKLRELVLHGLPNLKQTALNSNEFHGNVYTELEKLCISGYGSLRNVFSPSMARNLKHLKKLEIRDSEEIVEVIATAGQGQEETTDEIIFPQLTSLKLQNMPKLSNFWNCGCQEQHEKIKVESDLRQSQPLFGKKVAFPALENLYVCELESLRCIWEDEYRIGNSFSQLKSLEVQQCTRLENVVPSTMLKRLQNLKKLIIRDCAAVTSEVVTPRLAKLRELVLHDLPNLKQTALNSNEFHGNVYTELEKLRISGYGSLRNVFSPSVARNLKHLKELEIGGSEEIVEVIATEGQGQEETTDEIIFPQLTSLKLQNMPKLSNFWNCGCQEQHEEIKVESDLRQPQPLFRKKFLWNDGSHGFLGLLEVLVIDGCSILKNMFSCSMARCFQQLRVFVIRFCPAMEEVIYDDEGGKGGTSDQIVFPRLKFLKLETLPKFTGFCSANHDLNMPSLIAVGLYECHQMGNFTSGQIFTPRIRISPGPHRSLWITDLNDYLQGSMVDGNDAGKYFGVDYNEFMAYRIFGFGSHVIDDYYGEYYGDKYYSKYYIQYPVADACVIT